MGRVSTGQLPTLEKQGWIKLCFCLQTYTASTGNFRDVISNGSFVWARTSRLAEAFCLGWGLPAWAGGMSFGLDVSCGLGTTHLGLGLPSRLVAFSLHWASHLGWGFHLDGEASRLGWGLPSGLGKSCLG